MRQITQEEVSTESNPKRRLPRSVAMLRRRLKKARGLSEATMSYRRVMAQAKALRWRS